MQRFAPTCSALEGYEERLAGPVRQRHLPPTSVPLILNFGPPYLLLDPRIRAGAGASQRSSFVSGLGEAGGMTESTGAALCVQVDLTPLGARRILGVPMRELEDREVALADVLGAAVARLEERLDAQPTGRPASRSSRRSSAVGSARARCRRGPTSCGRGGGSRRRAAGFASTSLPPSSRCSRKHLLAQFREHVGPAPKTAARHRALQPPPALLGREPHAELGGAGVPLRLRRPVALSPRSPATRRLHAAELAAPSPVTFVQDALAAAS